VGRSRKFSLDLVFPGRQSEKIIEQVINGMIEPIKKIPPFTLQFYGLGAFKSISNPRFYG